MAAYVFYPTPWLLLEGWRSKAWPQVNGVIYSTKTVQSNTSRLSYYYCTQYIPVIVYDYEVESVNYTNKRVRFASYYPNCIYNNQWDAQAVVDRYLVGKQVAVFYDPSNSNNSILEPGMQGNVLRSDAIAVGLVIFAGWLPTLLKRRSTATLEPAESSPARNEADKKVRKPFFSIKITRRNRDSASER